jgi:hypothetical protein
MGLLPHPVLSGAAAPAFTTIAVRDCWVDNAGTVPSQSQSVRGDSLKWQSLSKKYKVKVISRVASLPFGHCGISIRWVHNVKKNLHFVDRREYLVPRCTTQVPTTLQ